MFGCSISTMRPSSLPLHLEASWQGESCWQDSSSRSYPWLAVLTESRGGMGVGGWVDGEMLLLFK